MPDNVLLFILFSSNMHFTNYFLGIKLESHNYLPTWQRPNEPENTHTRLVPKEYLFLTSNFEKEWNKILFFGFNFSVLKFSGADTVAPGCYFSIVAHFR